MYGYCDSWYINMASVRVLSTLVEAGPKSVGGVYTMVVVPYISPMSVLCLTWQSGDIAFWSHCCGTGVSLFLLEAGIRICVRRTLAVGVCDHVVVARGWSTVAIKSG